MKTDNFHENTTQTKEMKFSSNRSFGLLFSLVFTIVAFFPILNGGKIRIIVLIIALIILICSFAKPVVFKYPNLLWNKFGLLLNKVTNPIILFIIFTVVIIPTSIIMKVFKKDPMSRAYSKSINSYWIKKSKEDSDKFNMDNQF